MFHFEKFPVYIAAEKFNKDISYLLKNSSSISLSLRDQLDRASSSILLNIAEGAGKYSKRDKRNFYTIARGSVHECVAILRLLRVRGFFDAEKFDNLYNQLDIISRMLSGLIKKMSV